MKKLLYSKCIFLVTSESVSRRDPPILSIIILHSLIDLVAAAQLSFPLVCTEASLLSNCSAHVTEMLLCGSAFLLVSTKSLRLRHPTSTDPFPQLVQQKSRITNHSSKVQLDHVRMVFLDTSYVACISRHTATTPVLILPWVVCFPDLRVFSRR